MMCSKKLLVAKPTFMATLRVVQTGTMWTREKHLLKAAHKQIKKQTPIYLFFLDIINTYEALK